MCSLKWGRIPHMDKGEIFFLNNCTLVWSEFFRQLAFHTTRKFKIKSGITLPTNRYSTFSRPWMKSLDTIKNKLISDFYSKFWQLQFPMYLLNRLLSLNPLPLVWKLMSSSFKIPSISIFPYWLLKFLLEIMNCWSHEHGWPLLF